MQSGNQSTALVEFFNYRLASDDGNGDIIVGYQYEYDNGGNITDIKAEVDGALIPLEHYEYEEKQGQLETAIRYENGEEADRWTYSYDTAGNILSEDHEGTASEVHEYAYEDGRWGDLLTSVDGIDLEYDGSGNPTLYANGTELLWNMEWQNGRQLSRVATERDSTTEDVLDFAYDANGIRTSKTVTRNTYRPVQTYKVTFVADGKTVKTMSVTEGYTLKDSDYPAVPTKSGYSGAWKPYTAAIHNDITINAVYTALKTKHTVIFFADGKALKTMQVDNGYTLQASDYPAIPPKEGYTSRWDTRVTRIVKDTAIYAIYSDSSTHTVTFIFAEVECGTLTVADGYILQDSDYPAPLVPSKDVSAVAVWEKYTLPIHEDITVRGNWQGGAVLPTEPSYPDEIMSGGEGEPVEADEPEENGAEPYSAGAMDEADTITHDYLTQSGKVARETIRQSVGGTVLSTKTLDFFYDESGRPFAFNYSVDGGIASTYYYILNLQGDVVQIIDANGVMQAEYIYSPWGEIISAEGDLAEVNPLRYRGYYYDSETGFYYLQSRYYDPENHRFINADVYTTTDASNAISCNMFAYCENRVIMAEDRTGMAVLLPQYTCPSSVTLLYLWLTGDGSQQNFDGNSNLAASFRASQYMNDRLDECIENYKVTGVAEYSGSGYISGFSEFDLWMGVRSFDYEVTVSKEHISTGFWIFKKEYDIYHCSVKIYDKYNFNSNTDSGDGIGSTLNNFAYDLHQKGVGRDYEWTLSYTTTRGDPRHHISPVILSM